MEPVQVDNLQDKRVITLFEKVTRDWWLSARDSLLRLACRSQEPIHLLVDSGGGDVDVALAAYSLIRSLAAPTYTYGISRVSSAALDIFLAGEKRYSFAHATYFFHDVGIEFGQIPFGEHFEERLAERKAGGARIHEQVVKLCMERSRCTEEQIESLFLMGDRVGRDILPAQMLEMGFIDEIIEKLPL